MAKKFIDVEMLIDELSASCMPIFEKGISGILGDEQSIADVIREQPSADVQEVVRCKDCKYFLKYKGSNECFCYKGDLLNIIKPDDYCSQSVRMGDNMNEI